MVMEQIPLDPEVLGPERTPPNNGNGRPKGARNLKHRTLERAARSHSLPIVMKMVEMALQGDTIAAKIILDRTWPRPRTALVALDLPQTNNPGELRAAMHNLLGRVANGEIPPDAGAALMQIMRDVLDSHKIQTFDGAGAGEETEETNARDLLATRLVRAIEERQRRGLPAAQTQNGGD